MSPQKILLVDDNELSRKLVGGALRRAGFVVAECGGARAALAMIESGGPMLLVLDYDMPELTGAQVCERVRGNPNPAIATLPVILLTAHAGEDHEVECLGAGADDFVTKPINIVILKARIETQIRLYAMRAQLREQHAELERWRDRHELDLGAAQLTQQAILPQRPPVIEGWELSSHYQPVIQVGGDMFDWVRLPSGGWLVWIADATGHGAAAALLTTLTKLVFLHATSEPRSAAEILDAVNADVFAVFKGHSYLTAACVILSPARDEVDFAGAGHPPLMVARKDGSVEAVESQSPPIGVRPELQSAQSRILVSPGDTVLLYTDGLYSTDDEAGQPLTPADVPALLPKGPLAACEFLRLTVNAVNQRAKHQPLPDDFAALVLLRQGGS